MEVVARDGYADARIGEVAKCAGVSRATFYELFANKEDCLLAAQRALAARISAELAAAIADGDSSRAAQSALGALMRFADREPAAFEFVMHEAMLASPRALDERDRLIGGLERAIEASWQRTPQDQPTPDMSARILLEGTVRLLDLRMRREADAPRRLHDDLIGWIESYAVCTNSPRWRALRPNPALLGAPTEHPAVGGPLRALPRGRHRLGTGVVRGVQRERITYATAEVIRDKGYANITVADIVATAGVSRDVFYANYHDKEEAFEATIQLLFEQLLATMAGAFFGHAGDWPEQVWEAGTAFVDFLEENPGLANFLFVGTYAPPSQIERVHEFVLAFTLFIEGGNSYRAQSARVPRIVTEAIVCSVLEAVSFQIRHGRVQRVRGLIPLITYMVYAPFMGTRRAAEFVDAKIDAAQAAAACSRS